MAHILIEYNIFVKNRSMEKLRKDASAETMKLHDPRTIKWTGLTLHAFEIVEVDR